MRAVAHADRSLNPPSTLQANLANFSAGFCAFTVIVYQAWFMPFALPLFAGRDGSLRLALYALYGVVLVFSVAVVATRRDVRKAIFPLAIGAMMAVAPIALHPVGIVNRSYLTTLALGGSTIVLMLAFAPMTVLRLSASVTALNAILCFLDVLFVHGFTNTLGRAAGLALNPNVAAAGLLLGAAASYRAVAKEWRLSFLVLVGGALVITVSRSTLLAAVPTLVAPIAVGIWQRYRTARQFQVDTAGWTRALVVGLVLLGATVSAFTANRYFRIATSESFAGVLLLSEALNDAGEAVDTSLDRSVDVPVTPFSRSLDDPASSATVRPEHIPRADDERPLSIEPSGIARSESVPSSPEASPPRNVTPPSEAGPSATSAARIQAISERLRDEGKRNSISARALFLERSLLAYRAGGFFGRGLEEAHPFVPHNSFVLFAIAFGHIGWLVPLGLLGFAFCFMRDAEDLPLGIALAGVMLTSHDVLLTPSLFVPVAIGIGGMLAARITPSQSKRAQSSFSFGVVGGVVLFVIGYIAALLFLPPTDVGLSASPLCFALLCTIIAWSAATLYLLRRSCPMEMGR
ncbi:hypothetical protein EJ070_33025 [Mesorhizobium sp. M1E.F.Ca.ET.045.02.1.1]|uniref:O-antigen ligase family protein n=1 Tax=Mesorhizobium sp. M1E.F.Ca.ET.045.02.1.1 TaxID=2493672 RepID=UPI000F762746|nr:O-antigen ligase family protein [Mesorhizobium sp. M1E.F.Ca.ET.045.02.1.1]AZO25009.1 hypothetical protein EJ070_33025 [Mesorhizobium sp. M1E.F.Ca.ET.045.02.1.1]TKB17565.1 MAG: hypothetical protein E5V75_11440 [Mesorhizobium sp.]